MRTTEHPSGEALMAFMSGRSSGADAELVERHLRSGCVRCLRRLHREVAAARRRASAKRGLRVPETGRGIAKFVDLQAIRRQAVSVDRQATLIEVERIVAPELLGDLLLLPEAERRSAVREEDRYRFYGVAELLIAECRSECFRDVARAIELGRLAVESADALSRDVYPSGLATDAVALAWGALGNAHRVRADLVEAERALQAALEIVERGSGDRVARAEVLSLLGSLRTDQARFDEGSQVLGTAASVYRMERDCAKEAKCLLKLANASGEMGDCDRAAAWAVEARSLIDPVEDEWLYLFGGQTLAAWLLEAGRPQEARIVRDELLDRYRSGVMDAASVLRLEWLGARLLWAEGTFSQAEAELQKVRDGYRDRGSTYDVCLVSLDLARLYLEQGRTAEVREVASELVPIFASRQIHHHALAAVNLFQRAVETDRATTGFIRELVRYLHHSRRNPYLKFEPSEA